MEHPTSDSVERLAQHWAKEISQGKLRAGDPMPKVRYWAQTMHLSHTTVIKALRRLEEGGLLHSVGKHWHVGPSPTVSDRKPRSPTTAPTIVLVCRRAEEWSEFHQSLLQKLALRFGLEADRFGVRLVPVLTHPPLQGHPLFPCGTTEIRTLVRSLAGSYLGAVLVPLRDSLTDFDTWVKFLNRMGKPVVWIQDSQPDLPLFGDNVFRISFGDWGRQGLESSTGIALDALHRAGHRKAVVPCHVPAFFPWVLRRMQLLEEARIHLGMPICLETNLCSSLPDPDDPKSVRRLLSRTTPRTWEPVQQILSSCAAHSPTSGWRGLAREDREFVVDALLLQPLMEDSTITAIIAPNDELARRFYSALRRAGVRIPQDISMVSFDNAPGLRPYPISSVDFGMDLLGYQAFHLLFGVVPVQTTRSRHLFGINSLADHGSIGAPKAKGPFRP